MKILVTGAAGFIGFHLCKHLMASGVDVVGIDDVNDYYEVSLKLDRLRELGIQNIDSGNGKVLSQVSQNFSFLKLQLQDQKALSKLFEDEQFTLVINLAAQAGVRYSLEAPFQYIDSNITGFLNILECCRHYNVKKLIYASSSSVYGLNDKIPFSTDDVVDHPISLYAASKKSNELMAHTYSHLFGIQTVGLRFFTVYGPWGRPDMAMFLFTKAIIEKKPIQVFNEGKLSRDFTYIDDIIGGILNIIEALKTNTYQQKYGVYNIGNSKPVALLDFIKNIENELGVEAIYDYQPMQAGDVENTWADVAGLKRDFNYNPNTPIEKGIHEFVKWYKSYYKL